MAGTDRLHGKLSFAPGLDINDSSQRTNETRTTFLKPEYIGRLTTMDVQEVTSFGQYTAIGELLDYTLAMAQ